MSLINPAVVAYFIGKHFTAIDASGALNSVGAFSVATNKMTVDTNGNVAIAGTLAITGAVTSAVTMSGALTLTGGLVGTVDRVSTVPVGSVAYGSFGTNTTPVAGTLYLAPVWLPANKTITGVGVLQGTAVGTDKAIVSLWNSDGTTLLANSALAGTTMTATDAFQQYAFTGTYAAKGPARFWIGVQLNGTTARLRTVAANTFLIWAGSATPGAFGTLGTTITPPSTFTADKAPIAYVY